MRVSLRSTISQLWAPDGIPASAGAIVLDDQGRLLVLDPNYKDGWTIPGGVMEADGETPWEACQREVLEETGLRVTTGRLVCVDTRPAKPAKGRKLGLRFLFHCGSISRAEAEGIRVQRLEITRHRFVPVDVALEMLRPAVRRRVAVGLATGHCAYLENGRPIDAVRD